MALLRPTNQTKAHGMRRGLVHARRGNTVLEAALVIPILLLLAFGTVEFGHYFYVRNNMQGAAREGARAAIPPSATNSDVNAAVLNSLTAAGLQGSGYTVTTSPANIGSAATGTAITVTITCDWGAVGLRPMQMISTTKQVRGQAVMRKEG